MRQHGLLLADSLYVLLSTAALHLPHDFAEVKNVYKYVNMFNIHNFFTNISQPQSWQTKILYSILYTNSKLYKIGYTAVDKCSFCELEPETLPHLFFHCVYSQLYWKQFESYYYSLTKEFVHLTLQDILIGIITSKCPLLNYLLLVGISLGL